MNYRDLFELSEGNALKDLVAKVAMAYVMKKGKPIETKKKTWSPQPALLPHSVKEEELTELTGKGKLDQLAKDSMTTFGLAAHHAANNGADKEVLDRIYDKYTGAAERVRTLQSAIKHQKRAREAKDAARLDIQHSKETRRKYTPHPDPDVEARVATTMKMAYALTKEELDLKESTKEPTFQFKHTPGDPDSELKLKMLQDRAGPEHGHPHLRKNGEVHLMKAPEGFVAGIDTGDDDEEGHFQTYVEDRINAEHRREISSKGYKHDDYLGVDGDQRSMMQQSAVRKGKKSATVTTHFNFHTGVFHHKWDHEEY